MPRLIIFKCFMLAVEGLTEYIEWAHSSFIVRCSSNRHLNALLTGGEASISYFNLSLSFPTSSSIYLKQSLDIVIVSLWWLLRSISIRTIWPILSAIQRFISLFTTEILSIASIIAFQNTLNLLIETIDNEMVSDPYE